MASVLSLSGLFKHLFRLVVHLLSFRRSVLGSTTAFFEKKTYPGIEVTSRSFCSNSVGTPRRLHISSTAAIDHSYFPVDIAVKTLLFGRIFAKFEDLDVVQVGDQILRLFAELVDLLRLSQVLKEWFLMLVVLELLEQLLDLVLACCILLLDCRRLQRTRSNTRDVGAHENSDVLRKSWETESKVVNVGLQPSSIRESQLAKRGIERTSRTCKELKIFQEWWILFLVIGFHTQDAATAVCATSAKCPGIVVLPAGILISLTCVVFPEFNSTIRPKVLGGTWSGFHWFHLFGPLSSSREFNYWTVLGFPGETKNVEKHWKEGHEREGKRRTAFFCLSICVYMSFSRSHCCCSCHVGLKPVLFAAQPKLRSLSLYVFLRQFHRLHFS